ncbi:MAG TPA: phosphatase PAP2 family protein [Acidimicrobiales bacterium]|nr:phosphatase PAP2 family protein [Acidimicrobiales bacterium]
MLLNHRRALKIAGALLAATVVMFAAVALDDGHGPIQALDDAWLDAMVAIRWTPLVWLAKIMAFTGSVWVNWPLRILALGVLAWKRRWVQLSAFALAIVSSEILIGTVKVLYERPRPPGSLIDTSGFSFPSGHAIAGAVTAVGLVIVLLQPGSRRWKWELRAAAFAFLMAASRPYLGAHWLTDVVAGGLLGVTLAIGWPALLQELRDRRRAMVRASG